MPPADSQPDAALHAGRPPLPEPGDRHWAWFLDVDGTLIEIARQPDLVSADRALLTLLERLSRACDGAVALISGRSLKQLEAIFDPLKLAAGASHGLELRAPDGSVRRLGRAFPEDAAARIAAFAAQHEGLLVERKTMSMTVHYRERPQLEGLVLETLQRIHADMDNEFRLLRGKMVVEIVQAAANKGSAIRTFMAMAPFAGRRPVFVGDDVTDEDGFAVVNEMGGISVHIGDRRDSAARWRFASTAELRDWLHGSLYLL
jgi:trehalose 6-phosphate phosphatase